MSGIIPQLPYAYGVQRQLYLLSVPRNTATTSMSFPVHIADRCDLSIVEEVGCVLGKYHETHHGSLVPSLY